MKTKILIFFLCVAGSVVAQNSTTTIDKAVERTATLYSLTDHQIDQLEVIEARRERSYAEIAELESSDYHLYLEYRQAIDLHMEGSIRRMLTTDQRRIQDQLRTQHRLEISDLVKQLKQEGKTKEEIELALLQRRM